MVTATILKPTYDQKPETFFWVAIQVILKTVCTPKTIAGLPAKPIKTIKTYISKWEPLFPQNNL